MKVYAPKSHQIDEEILTWHYTFIIGNFNFKLGYKIYDSLATLEKIKAGITFPLLTSGEVAIPEMKCSKKH